MGELFKSVAGIDMLHVPFKGMGQASPELASGRVQLAVSTVPGMLPHVKAGRMQRHREQRHAPLVADARRADLHRGKPAADSARLLPRDRRPGENAEAVIDEAAADARRHAVEPGIARAARRAGGFARPIGGTPEELAKLMRSEYERYGKVIKAQQHQGRVISDER